MFVFTGVRPMKGKHKAWPSLAGGDNGFLFFPLSGIFNPILNTETSSRLCAISKHGELQYSQ